MWAGGQREYEKRNFWRLNRSCLRTKKRERNPIEKPEVREKRLAKITQGMRNRRIRRTSRRRGSKKGTWCQMDQANLRKGRDKITDWSMQENNQVKCNLAIPRGDKYTGESLRVPTLLQPLLRHLQIGGWKDPGESKASGEPLEQNSQWVVSDHYCEDWARADPGARGTLQFEMRSQTKPTMKKSSKTTTKLTTTMCPDVQSL